MNLLGSTDVSPGSLSGPKRTLSVGVYMRKGTEMSGKSSVEEEAGVHGGLGLRYYMHASRFGT